MAEMLEFETREAFREWLTSHSQSSGGIWLLIGKMGGPKTISAAEALEEALCFGWIDGQMQSLGDKEYKKYFARRVARSRWSEKNRKLAGELIRQGRMEKAGLDAIERARANSTWEVAERAGIEDSQIDELKRLIIGNEPACSNFIAMSKSVQRTYAAFYLDAKGDATRKARLERIVERLNRNLKPM